jgi:hypothetical protein
MTIDDAMLEAYIKRYGEEEAKRRIEATKEERPPEGNTSLVIFLASDAADNVNGCVFDVVLGRVSIYRDPPEIQHSLIKEGNWTPEELVELMPKTLTKDKVRELPPRPTIF